LQTRSSDAKESNGYKRKWQVEKRLDVGHILVIVSLLIAAYTTFIRMDDRITTVETTQSKVVEVLDSLSIISTSNKVLLDERGRRFSTIEQDIRELKK